jgi:Glycosyl transferase family 90
MYRSQFEFYSLSMTLLQLIFVLIDDGFHFSTCFSLKVFATGFRHSYSTVNGQKVLEVDMPRDLFTKDNLKKFERPWDEKVPTAFFRGTATGGGVTIETNQRLYAAHLSYIWHNNSKTDPNVVESYPYLDAKITGWNLRDKKISSGKMTFLRSQSFPFTGDKKNFVPIYEQSKYKYVLYIEGHCAACRYGFMMQLGSVILKVESRCVADQMWYFPLLRPYVDHVPIKSDFSDLKEKIEWCRNHDSECQQIAINAKALYNQYISRDGILDYLQSIFVEISNRHSRDPQWAPRTNKPQPVPMFSSIVDGAPRVCVKVGNYEFIVAIRHTEPKND